MCQATLRGEQSIWAAQTLLYENELAALRGEVGRLRAEVGQLRTRLAENESADDADIEGTAAV